MIRTAERTAPQTEAAEPRAGPTPGVETVPGRIVPKPPPDPADLPVWPHTVQGGKMVESLKRHVENLRDEQGEHGNRVLFLDDLFVVHLLAFFNPSINSLRTIEDFSQTAQAQKHLSVPKVCKSTHSDLNAIADAGRLQPIIAELRDALKPYSLATSVAKPYRTLLKEVIAVDGTFLPALAQVAWAVRSSNKKPGPKGHHGYRARVDVHLDVRTGLPECIVIPEPKQSEAKSAAATVKPGAVHIYDRGFCSIDLLSAHFGTGPEPVAHFVQRLRGEGGAGGNTAKFVVETELAVDPLSRECGVVSDRLGRLPGLKERHGIDPLVREVVIVGSDGSVVRLFTSILELPAHLVGMLYKMRWRVELFFKWLKSHWNLDHLICTKKEGMLFHFHVVVVGVLLMHLHTDAKPSKYMLAMFGLLASGAARLDEILPILRERERRCKLDRQSAARRAPKKKKA